MKKIIMIGSSEKILIFAAILLAVFAGVFGYTEKAGAIYGGGYSQIPAVGLVGIGSTNGDVNRPQIRCSGTLITPTLVLTSENCFTNVPLGSIINFWPSSSISYRAPAINFFYFYAGDLLGAVELASPIPSYIATPLPIDFQIRDLDGFILTMVGLGPPCVGQCGALSDFAQRAVTFRYPSSVSYICNGGYGQDNDAGGPVLVYATGHIVGVLSAGYCGQGGRDEFDEIYRFETSIREAMGQHYGPPFCTADIRYDANFHQFQPIFTPYKTGDTTCSWVLDGNAQSGSFDCVSGIPGFPETSLSPGTHELKFTIQDPYGASSCVTPAFSVSVPPGYPQFVISPQNTNAGEGAPVRLEIKDIICIAGPCGTQWMLPSQARISEASPSSQSFASIGLLNDSISSLLSHIFQLIPRWNP